MNKIFTYLLIVLGAVTVSILAWFFITMSRTEFNFANDGKIICVTQKASGFGQPDELTCFDIKPVGQVQDTQTFKCDTLNGEIVIKK